jgi:membrane-associated protease RseP (regulator of RpoE activity)
LLLHSVLLIATIGTTYVSGAFPVLVQLESAGWTSLLTNRHAISSGLAYSLTILAILFAHELRHYFACRYYGVRATLPFFIPAPPPFMLIGTFGAFIRIKEPITSRRALFDIGIAGPLAGFAVAIPAALFGLWIAKPALPLAPGEGSMVFNDPLLFMLIQRIFDLPVFVEWNPVHFAAWVGMLATSLNLLPVGQLDGGHVVYALLGSRGHKIVGRGFFVLIIGLAFWAYSRHRWAGWFIYAGMLGLLLGLKHPSVSDEDQQVGRSRQIFGVVALIVFILCFMPFPITMT